MRPKPFLLLILDGWGYREERDSNALAQAATPVWDRLWAEYPRMLIETSGKAVGLPTGQMGNSEVGHMNIGAGRVVFQDFTRVGDAVDNGELDENPALSAAMRHASASGSAVHLLGLLSPGGVHSHEDHVFGLIAMAARCGVKKLYLHAFLDGRDTPPRSAAESLERGEQALADAGVGRIASLCGRYYAMDRDRRWERVEQAYQLITDGQASYQVADAATGLSEAYQRGEDDEFIKPTRIGEPAPMESGDSVIFANFRADRAREITQALIEPQFEGFSRPNNPALAHFVAMTEYYSDLPTPASVAFPPISIGDSLGEVISAAGMSQLRIAETEKYPHVTYFFNGGRETEFPGEQREVIPSPRVATYDLAPAMSAETLTQKLCEAIRGQQYDLIVCNYANPDMVGHTGDFSAACIAAEVIDDSLARILTALEEAGGEMLVTADHGNLEQMRDPLTGQPHTAHTTNPVPLVYVGRPLPLAASGALCDIAPTILRLLNLPAPAVMQGQVLLADESDAVDQPVTP